MDKSTSPLELALPPCAFTKMTSFAHVWPEQVSFPAMLLTSSQSVQPSVWRLKPLSYPRPSPGPCTEQPCPPAGSSSSALKHQGTNFRKDDPVFAHLFSACTWQSVRILQTKDNTKVCFTTCFCHFSQVRRASKWNYNLQQERKALGELLQWQQKTFSYIRKTFMKRGCTQSSLPRGYAVSLCVFRLPAGWKTPAHLPEPHSGGCLTLALPGLHKQAGIKVLKCCSVSHGGSSITCFVEVVATSSLRSILQVWNSALHRALLTELHRLWSVSPHPRSPQALLFLVLVLQRTGNICTGF